MKLARVEIAREVIGGFVRVHPEGWWVRVREGLPEDAELVWLYLDPDGRTISAVFTHDSFPDVGEGLPVPQRAVSLESWNGQP